MGQRLEEIVGLVETSDNEKALPTFLCVFNLQSQLAITILYSSVLTPNLNISIPEATLVLSLLW